MMMMETCKAHVCALLFFIVRYEHSLLNITAQTPKL
jgi:hypothetical protein